MIEARGLRKVYGMPERKARSVAEAQGADRNSIAAAGGFLALDDVSFAVEAGELFVIMGLSGSGKSTLIRMINRLISPSAGSMHFEGVDVASMDDAALRTLRNERISMVFQHFALFPHRSTLENAAYGLKVRGVPESERLERAREALEQVGLGDRGDSFPDQLSGGMKQRVGLARALATDADVLLMDEPFSALDPLIRRDMQTLLLELQAKFKKTVVFVTHDLNEAMRLGDRIMVMKDGGVVQLDTGPDIVSEPADDYVREFVADIDRGRVLTAETIMRPPLLTALVDAESRAVLRQLENVEANGVYVLDAAGTIVGVASDSALAKGSRSGESLSSCIGSEFRCVAPDTALVDLCHLAGRYVVPLAVVDARHRLLGVVPRAAVLGALASNEDDQGFEPDWLPLAAQKVVHGA